MRCDLEVINQKRQSGSALVIAIFVLVMMTLLGSALIRMQNSTAETVVYEVMGARAYAAAKTGLQWQLTEIFPLDPTIPFNPPDAELCKINIVEPIISDVTGLENCQFEITCDDSISHDNVQYYTLTSTGTCSVAGVETSRRIKIEARSIN